ncbi:MAG: hypothetical protein RRA45_10495 [Saccharolobus sp.]|uniref:hypothetical protein n=1 Tax=Saccharolobus sp. TaxID=2100761 RepID=UPI0028CC2594|nr:hypothetical protein [Saccharolobus sp.]MDT7862623.1 hypothetical protein [Saccharolobus sp.]
MPRTFLRSIHNNYAYILGFSSQRIFPKFSPKIMFHRDVVPNEINVVRKSEVEGKEISIYLEITNIIVYQI